MKLTKKQFDDFVKHYNWYYVQDPTYRVGQAFLNYFPAYERKLLEDGNYKQMDVAELWNDTDAERCWQQIRSYIEE